jgi:tetratricopeptide (TPR) repeat protein
MSDNNNSIDLKEAQMLFKDAQKAIDKAQKLMQQSKWEEATNVLITAIKTIEGIEAPLIEAQAYFHLGVIYENAGKWAASLEAFQSCLRLQADRAGKLQIGSTYIKIAQIQMYLNQNEASHDNAQAAIDVLETENVPLASTHALYLKGSLYILEKNMESAIFYLNLALDQLKIQYDLPLFLKCQENLGFAYKNLGRFDEAIQAYMFALEIEQKMKNYPTISAILESLAEAYHMKNDKSKCLAFYDEAIEIKQKIKLPTIKKPMQRLYAKYAEALLFFREYPKAESICEEAIVIAEEFNFKNELMHALILMAKILAAFHRGPALEATQVENFLNEAEEIAIKESNKQMLIKVRIQRALLYKNKGDQQKFEVSLEETLQIALKEGQPTEIGEVYEQFGIYHHISGNFEDSYEYFQKALQHFKDGNAQEELAEANYNLACSACRLHLAEDTITYLKRAIMLEPKYKRIAAEDEDFKSIWQDKPFKDLIE